MLHDLKTDYHMISVSGKQIQTKQLYFEENLDESQPVLVFLHEGLGCIDLWKDFPEQLCLNTGLDALVYDRVGHGQSDISEGKRKKDYLHIEAFYSLPSILEKLNLENVILIGHSDGGTIALLYASRYSDIVSGVITEAAHTYVDDRTIQGISQAVHEYENGTLREKLLKYHGTKTDKLFEDWQKTWLSPWFRDWNIEEELVKITSPVLAIQGVNDQYGQQTQLNIITENVSGKVTQLYLPNCAHTPHIEAKTKVLQSMSDFIKNL